MRPEHNRRTIEEGFCSQTQRWSLPTTDPLQASNAHLPHREDGASDEQLVIASHPLVAMATACLDSAWLGVIAVLTVVVVPKLP